MELVLMVARTQKRWVRRVDQGNQMASLGVSSLHVHRQMGTSVNDGCTIQLAVFLPFLSNKKGP